MRPIELTISAFGAYAGKQVIDFRLLGNSGLYLITGNTGAGKTTIFDAISFALFGNASGESRDAKMMRSKLASADTPTYVELVFEYSGKIYTVRRSPEYERLAKRGEGTTKQSADAYIILPDGKTPISKVSEVTEFVENLLGINSDQFSQIAMIAQGEFQKLLNADSKSRREIFRKLFRTEKYNELEDLLKTEANKLFHECDAAGKSIKQYIEGILCDPNNELASTIEGLKHDEVPVSEAEVLLERIITKDTKDEENITSELVKLDSRVTELTTELNKQSELEKVRKTLSLKKTELETKTKELQQAKEDKESALVKKPEADKLRKNAVRLEGDLTFYEEREECRKEFEDAKRKFETAKNSKENNSNLLKSIGDDLEKTKKEQSALDDAEDERAKLISEQARIKAQLSSLERINATITSYNDVMSELKEAQNNYTSKKSSHQKAQERYDNSYTLFLDSQAGMLALDLKENEPCPVCGSLEHPDLAQPILDSPTEEELESLKKERDNTESAMRRASNRASELSGQLSSLEKSLKSQFKDFTDKNDLCEAIKEIKIISAGVNKENGEIEHKIGAIKKKIERRKELGELIKKLLDKRGTTSDNIAKDETALKVEKARMETAEKRGEVLSNKLQFKTIDEARLEINKLNRVANEITNRIDLSIERYNSIVAGLAELNGIIKQLEEQLKGAPIIDVKKKTDELSALTDKKKVLKDADRKLSDRISANNRTLKNLDISNKKSKALFERYEWLRNLSDTANGNLNGRDKIMLEIYVQTRFFDRIIKRANSRFFKMTGGQFELKRAESVANKTSQAGLDLNVIDHHNGSERSVKSLSGGESFMASLSLALGLSDEIQASAGGIKLETMFIDEGFGTLDAETLKQAMDTLSALADPDGGKLIGIISHVDELKSRIDKQISVSKDKNGISNAKVIV